MYNITFILVTYNGENYIENCIKSIYKFSKNAKIILIDNNSTDNTKIIVDTLKIFKKIYLENNLGFGKSNNIGIKEALKFKQDAIFLINQDVYFHSGDFNKFISISLESFKNNKYGIISPIHLQGNGVDYDFKFLDYISKKNTPNLLNDLSSNLIKDKVYKSKAVNAAAWLVSMECFNTIGVFDPIFPHYGEDSDFINRLHYHNLKIGVLPLLKIIHDRKQYNIDTQEKQIYSIKIWSLFFMKNINKSFFYLFLFYPIKLYFRIKRLKKGNTFTLITTFIKIYFYTLIKLPQIYKSRLKSKVLIVK